MKRGGKKNERNKRRNVSIYSDQSHWNKGFGSIAEEKIFYRSYLHDSRGLGAIESSAQSNTYTSVRLINPSVGAHKAEQHKDTNIVNPCTLVFTFNRNTSTQSLCLPIGHIQPNHLRPRDSCQHGNTWASDRLHLEPTSPTRQALPSSNTIFQRYGRSLIQSKMNHRLAAWTRTHIIRQSLSINQLSGSFQAQSSDEKETREGDWSHSGWRYSGWEGKTGSDSHSRGAIASMQILQASSTPVSQCVIWDNQCMVRGGQQGKKPPRKYGQCDYISFCLYTGADPIWISHKAFMYLMQMRVSLPGKYCAEIYEAHLAGGRSGGTRGINNSYPSACACEWEWQGVRGNVFVCEEVKRSKTTPAGPRDYFSYFNLHLFEPKKRD